jgi:hydrogenase assembly chaperone HypC/HupF
MCLSDAGRIHEVSEDGATGVVWLRGGLRTVSLSLLTLEGRRPQPGDWVLVSAGLAIEQIDESEAKEIASLTDGANATEERGLPTSEGARTR